MKEIISKNLTDTAQFAREFLAGLTPRANGAAVVGLYGDLGSGKTTFVQCVAKALDVLGSVQSPTFVILKSYQLQANHYRFLHHIDAYRLDTGMDLQKLGWNTLASDPANLILIEWADRVADILPPDHNKLHFEFVDDTTRKIALQ